MVWELKAQALLAEVKAGVAKVLNSEDWKRWLDFNSKFWHYSFYNQFLIASQFPHASNVAGFHKWKELGRHVKKGEHGISILAPRFVKIKEKDGEEADERRLSGFLVVRVFDISQTEGQEVPRIFHPLQGDAPAGLFGRLKEFISAKGYTVRIGKLPPGVYGLVNSSREIVLNEENSMAQGVETLCHEISHALLGHVGNSEMNEEQKELEAETSAWIICRNLGLDTREASFAYLATWAQCAERDEALEKAGSRACEIAREVLSGLAVEEKVAA